MGDGDAGSLPGALRYEELLADAGEGGLRLPRARRAPGGGALLHERHDGKPQGGALLAPLDQPPTPPATLMADGSGLSRKDRVLAVVPMFHANAWGLPYGAALAGSDLILPDRFLGAEALSGLIAVERPTLMGCVPTIFNDLLRYADEHPEVDPVLAHERRLRRIGGATSADEGLRGAPRRMRIFQAWGMTTRRALSRPTPVRARASTTTPTGTIAPSRDARCRG